MINVSPSNIHLICLCVCLALLTTIAQAETCATDDGGFQMFGETCVVRFFNGDLSVKVSGVFLHELLDEIAHQSGLKVVPYVILDERMVLEFHHLTLEQGLRRILRHRSYLLESAQQPHENRLSTVVPPMTLWILPQGEQEDYVPRSVVQQPIPGNSSEHWATEYARLRAILTSGQSSDREQAALELGDSGRTDAVPILSLALGDENQDVRSAAVSALLEIGGDEAVHAVSIALADVDPRVRAESVEALGEIGGKLSMDVLERSLGDDDEFVRDTAAEILGR